MQSFAFFAVLIGALAMLAPSVSYNTRCSPTHLKSLIIHQFAEEDLELLVSNTVTKCASLNHISAEQLVRLRATKDKTNFPQMDGMECFTKCIIDAVGILRADGIDVDRAVRVAMAQGIAADDARASVTKCQSMYSGGEADCACMWKLYTCFYS